MLTAAPAPKLAITRAVGSHRDFAWVALPLEDLREIGRTEGVTLNDVVLTVVTGALDHYLGDGARRTKIHPRVLVPVSTHGHLGDFENEFSMMVVDLPSGSLDPLSQLRATHAETTARNMGQAMIGPLLFGLGGLVPPWLLRSVAARWRSNASRSSTWP